MKASGLLGSWLVDREVAGLLVAREHIRGRTGSRSDADPLRDRAANSRWYQKIEKGVLI